MVRKQPNNPSDVSARAFLVPLMWIIALVASYWMLADWQTVPSLISTAFAAM